MFNLSSLARRFATGLIATQLAFGAVAASTVIATPASAEASFTYHGAWQGVAFRDDGQIVYGAKTDMEGGGTAAFMVKDGSLLLVVTNPKWDMSVGRTVTASVEIDGTTYDGSAKVISSDALAVSDVSFDVLKMFVDGAQARIDLNDGDIVWTLNLYGFTASMSDALQVYKQSV